MKTSLGVIALLGLLRMVDAQGLDASPCDTGNDCPTVLCCGWATPIEGSTGDEHKICYRPNYNRYTKFNGEEFSFQCDPTIEKINVDSERYSERFWTNLDRDGPVNIPGYGPNNVWKAPIRSPKSVITVYDRFLLAFQHNIVPLLWGTWEWMYNFGTGDSWDGFWYNNAAASGSQLYPHGLSKYYDVNSINGLFEYLWYYCWVFI